MNRIYLKPGDKVKLTHGEKFFEEWQIKAVIGEGASSVCYSATSATRSGRLKEFYPTYCSLIRQKNNSLTAIDKISENQFHKMRQEYLNCFKILDDARKKTNGTILNNFLPVQEILDNENGNVYIWTPDDKHGITFEKFLEVENSSPKKLFNILKIVEHLTKCIQTFHMLGIVHGDLNPSNFLVTQTVTGEINPANISLFDLNSIYNLGSDLPLTCGTKFFAAPELRYGNIRNRSDIYSIGSILFYAVTSDFYQPKFFEDINQIIACSDLIKSFISDNNSTFCILLTKILKKCLSESPQKRYRCCEELITDLQKLIFIMTPEISSNSLRTLHKKIILTDDVPQIVSPEIVIQNLLYNFPIFSHGQNTNIVVIGAGSFAQKFIDEALQAMQIPYFDERKFFERKVCIQIFSSEPEIDCENYLNFRPAIKNFVNVNGSLKNSSESYGQINFLPLPKTQITEEIISKFTEIHYIFIALGDDQTNFELAEDFLTEKINCPVNFSLQDTNFPIEKNFMANPVYLTETITPEKINPNLINWAFNVHLSWIGRLSDLDLNVVRKNFFERYNLKSSLAFALSIYYKFFSVGIKIDHKNYNASALEFAQKISDKEVLNWIAYYEHRRWNLEKICAGMQPPLTKTGSINYEHCLMMIRQYGKPQDKKAGLHPCIVKSRPDYDSSTPDDLDKMSLELHNALETKAAEFKRTQPLNGEDSKAIREIGGNSAAFKTFEFRLKQILAGNRYHSKNFNAYLNEFKNSFSASPPYIKENLNSHIENLRRDFIFVAESNIFRDYKIYDFILVKKIPFVLTYSPPHIALAFDDDDIFSSITSATILNPVRITYLHFFDSKSCFETWYQKICMAKNYLIERKIRAKINFVIAAENIDIDIEDIEKSLQKIDSEENFLKKVGNIEEAVNFFLETLMETKPDFFDGSTNLFTDQYRKCNFKKKILEFIPYFEVNATGFKNCHNCEHLSFVPAEFDLRSHEIFTLGNFKIQSFNDSLIEYANYLQKLWTVSSQAGFRTCRAILREYNCDNKNFSSVKISKSKTKSSVTLQYILPKLSGIKKFLNNLLSLGIIKNFVSNPIGESQEITICTKYKIEKALNKILRDFSNLADPDFLKIQKENNAITVYFSDLNVKNINVDIAELNILQEMSTKRLILNLKKYRQKISFNYSSNFIKKILVEDSILKSYVYLKASESGYFDEVLLDVEFTLPQDTASQKFDCFLTKNSSSIVVSFAEKFSLEKLHDFNNLADKLTVAKKVFIVEFSANSKDFEAAANLRVILLENSEDLVDKLKKIIEIS